MENEKDKMQIRNMWIKGVGGNITKNL